MALFSHTGMIQFCLTSGNHLVTCWKSELEHPLCRTKLEKKHNQEKINRKDKTSFFTTVRVPVMYHMYSLTELKISPQKSGFYKLQANSSHWDYKPLLSCSCTVHKCHKCDENYLPNSKLEVRIEIKYLCSDVPAHLLMSEWQQNYI